MRLSATFLPICEAILFSLSVGLVAHAEDFRQLKTGVVHITTRQHEKFQVSGSGIIVDHTQNCITILTTPGVIGRDPNPLVIFSGSGRKPIEGNVLSNSNFESEMQELALIMVSAHNHIPDSLFTHTIAPPHSILSEGQPIVIIGYGGTDTPWAVYKRTLVSLEFPGLLFFTTDNVALGAGILSNNQIVGIVGERKPPYSLGIPTKRIRSFLEKYHLPTFCAKANEHLKLESKKRHPAKSEE